MTAKSHGLEDDCQTILDASGLTEDQITLPSMGKPLSPPKPIVPTFKANWPTKATSSSLFEQTLMEQVENAQDQPAPAQNGFSHEEVEDTGALPDQDGHIEAEDDDAGGWDVGEEEVAEAEVEEAEVSGAAAGFGAGSSEADNWARTSPLAADHVAAGSFETAMQLLNRQVGAVNFAPLQERFEEIYQASRTFLPANPNMPPLVNFVRRTVDETDISRVQPLIPRDLESITATELAAGKRLMRENKLEEGLRLFKRILHLLMVNAVATQAQASEVSHILSPVPFLISKSALC